MHHSHHMTLNPMNLAFLYSAVLKSSQWLEDGYRRFFCFAETYLVCWGSRHTYGPRELVYNTFFECAHMYQRHCFFTLSSHTPDFLMECILKTLKEISNVFYFQRTPSLYHEHWYNPRVRRLARLLFHISRRWGLPNCIKNIRQSIFFF